MTETILVFLTGFGFGFGCAFFYAAWQLKRERLRLQRDRENLSQPRSNWG